MFKRKPVRIQLRTLLIATALCCVVLAWYTNSANKQRVAVEWIESFSGGFVKYDYEFEAGKYSAKRNVQLPVPEWMIQIFGIHFFSGVVHVHFDAPVPDKPLDLNLISSLNGLQSLHLCECNVSNLEPLADLQDLKILYIDRTPVSDVSHIANINALEGIYLNDTGIDDIEPLLHLPNIKWIDLREKNIDKSQVQRLRKEFPNIRLQVFRYGG